MLKKPSISIPNPAKVGSTAVKMPKAKSLPKPGDKPSIFFKTELHDFSQVKHPTLCKFRDFLEKKHRKP